MKKDSRQLFTGRQQFNTKNARIAIKRKTFADGKSPIVTLTGYPILWGETSSDRGGYVVKLAKGSAVFTDPALALFHHNFESIIGNTDNQTLRVMAADDTGIHIEIDLPDTTTGNDVAELVGKGYVKGMSFSMANGFEDYSEEKVGDQYILNVTKFTCDEVTVTARPAFTGTSIEVKPDDDETEDAPATNRIAAASTLQALRLGMLSV
jgi:HK97 family phage prohead protease